MRTVLPLTMPPRSGYDVRGCSCRRGCGNSTMTMAAVLHVDQGATAPHDSVICEAAIAALPSVIGETATAAHPIQRVIE